MYIESNSSDNMYSKLLNFFKEVLIISSVKNYYGYLWYIEKYFKQWQLRFRGPIVSSRNDLYLKILIWHTLTPKHVHAIISKKETNEKRTA